MENNKLAAGGFALGGLYLLTRGTDPASGEAAQSGNQRDPWDLSNWVPVSEDGEVGLLNGIVFDDPETGVHNDEPEDDANTSFETINNNDTTADDTDPTTYAPDVQDGSRAPSGGVISDPGDSQNWGSAPEEENDDLSQRAADSNLSGDQKSAFDRLANYDDPLRL